ncbi:hypothetical protein B0J17DRAFT_660657 [Rhizoctonia solani]|nr:hypothetical protein B0J17DRAFT_660657 [Rhizoctonia solani]
MATLRGKVWDNCRAGAVLYVGKSDVRQPDESSSTESPETLVPHPNRKDTLQLLTDMFNAPKAEDDEPEPGSSPEHPIVIKGVASSDFAALLQKSTHSRTHLIIPSFRLANLLTFSELRTYLLPLAEKNLCDEWLAPAHVRLCQREKPLSTEEARKLGVDSVLIVWRMREQYRTSSLQTSKYYCDPCAGMSYSSSSDTCAGCNSTGRLRKNGPGRMEQKAITVDGNLVIAGVKRWVDNDCVVEE